MNGEQRPGIELPAPDGPFETFELPTDPPAGRVRRA
jgi:hypothetical protein